MPTVSFDQWARTPSSTDLPFQPGDIAWVLENNGQSGGHKPAYTNPFGGKDKDCKVLNNAALNHPILLVRRDSPDWVPEVGSMYLGFLISWFNDMSVEDWWNQRDVRSDIRNSCPIIHPTCNNPNDIQFFAEKGILPLFQAANSPTLKSGKPGQPSKICYVKLDSWIQVPRPRLRQFNRSENFSTQPRLSYDSFVDVFSLLKTEVLCLNHIDTMDLYNNATARIAATIRPPPQVAVPSMLLAVSPPVDTYQKDILDVWTLAERVAKQGWGANLVHQSVNEVPGRYAFEKDQQLPQFPVIASVLQEVYQRYGITSIFRRSPTTIVNLAMAYNQVVYKKWHTFTQQESALELAACSRVTSHLFLARIPADKIFMFVLRSIVTIFINDVVFVISSVHRTTWDVLN